MSKIRFDLDDLTLDDLEDFEEWTGQTVDEAFSPQVVKGPDGKPMRDERGRPIKKPRVTAKSLKAVITIVKRKEDPNFTYEMSGKVKITELEIAGGDEDPEDKDAATNS